MSFFPDKIMPLSPKKDVTGTGSIKAADYNLHDTEIAAIEGFLLSGQIDISFVTDAINALNLFAKSGVQASSGYLPKTSAARIIVPEQVLATFLTSGIGATGNSIGVLSTLGFPDSGYISIITPTSATATNVEIIRYSSKNNTSFLNCVRGTMGTTASVHGSGLQTRAANQRTSCFSPVTAGQTVCYRPYPGYRRLSIYSYPALGLAGTREQMLSVLMNCPLDIDMNVPAAVAAQSAAADPGLNILRTGPTGLLYLGSNDPTAAAQNRLLYGEASGFLSGIGIGSDAQWLLQQPDDVMTTPVMVLAGGASIQFFPTAGTGTYGVVPISVNTAFGVSYTALVPNDVMNADGSVSISLPNLTTQLAGSVGPLTATGVAESYQVFCSSPPAFAQEGS